MKYAAITALVVQHCENATNTNNFNFVHCLHGEDLKKGVTMLNKGSRTKFLQYPSMGCNIKWVKGNEPKYE